MLNNSAPLTSVKYMKNKQLIIASSLLVVTLFSGCSSVEWREGSIFERNGGVRSQDTASQNQSQEQQTPAQEAKPQETQTQEQKPSEVVFVEEQDTKNAGSTTPEQPTDASLDETAVDAKSQSSDNMPLPDAVPNKVLTAPPYPSRELSASDLSLKNALEAVIGSSSSKSDIPRQMKSLEQLHQANPKSSGILYHLGRLAFFNDQPQDAIKYLQQALKVEDKNFYAANLLGLVYRSLGQFDKAETSYKSALNIWPDYATAWYNLGILQDLYKDDLKNAVVSYKNYLAIQQSKSANDPASVATDDKTQQHVELWVKDLEMRLSSQSK